MNSSFQVCFFLRYPSNGSDSINTLLSFSCAIVISRPSLATEYHAVIDLTELVRDAFVRCENDLSTRIKQFYWRAHRMAFLEERACHWLAFVERSSLAVREPLVVKSSLSIVVFIRHSRYEIKYMVRASTIYTNWVGTFSTIWAIRSIRGLFFSVLELLRSLGTLPNYCLPVCLIS